MKELGAMGGVLESCPCRVRVRVRVRVRARVRARVRVRVNVKGVAYDSPTRQSWNH